MEELQTELSSLRRELRELRELTLEIRDKLVEQTSEITRVAVSAENMDRHIGFVEAIWDRIRAPFSRALGFVGGGRIEG